MAVAKSYEHMEIISKPYNDEKGRPWVRIKGACPRCGGSGHYAYNPMDGTRCFRCGGSGKEILEVRWYSDEERARMDARSEARAELIRKKREEEILRRQSAEYNGFQNGYVIVIYGDTYSVKDELKEAGAHFTKALGWYFSDETNIPEKFIAQSIKITWEMVSKEGRILSETDVKEIVTKAIPKAEPKSEYRGKVGERLRGLELDVIKFWDGGGYYIHTMEDVYGNIFTWMTSSRAFEKGTHILMDATVKKQEEYNGVKQTYLTRPSIKEIKRYE